MNKCSYEQLINKKCEGGDWRDINLQTFAKKSMEGGRMKDEAEYSSGACGCM